MDVAAATGDDRFERDVACGADSEKVNFLPFAGRVKFLGMLISIIDPVSRTCEVWNGL